MKWSQVVSFVGGIVSGAVIGAAVALLLAPQSGSGAREHVAAQVRDLVEAGRQAADERRQYLRSEFETAIRIPLATDSDESE